jgi:acetylornithine/succinyldiaminopimelate/putrescine aminotransferase
MTTRFGRGKARNLGLQAVLPKGKLCYHGEVLCCSLKLMEAARACGLLIGKGGMFGNVIRISPPTNISRSDVDEFIRRLDQAFGAPQ